MTEETFWMFIHNPKTGGHSIRHALGLRDDGPLHEPRSHAPPTNWTFGFVRNPWTRLVSLYNFLVAGHYMRLDCTIDNDVSFKRWLMRDNRRLLGEPKGIIGLQRRPQMWWLEGCNFVGRFEHLQADFDSVCDQIGLERRTLSHLKRGRPADYRTEYDAEMRAAVAEWFADDIIRWGYVFS